MHLINISEAKAHFSKLIDLVLQGNEITIVKAGKPVAKLSPINQRPVRRFGILKGKVKIAKDFDAPLSENTLRDFET